MKAQTTDPERAAGQPGELTGTSVDNVPVPRVEPEQSGLSSHEVTTVERTYDNLEVMKINMGPQHPSTHGVLRCVVDLEGETVVHVRPVVGYLHSGKEKIAEVKTFQQFIPYTAQITPEQVRQRDHADDQS